MAFTRQERESRIQDLRAHIKDWKGHSVDELGPLYLHQVLTVRRESQAEKEYDVYLLDKALLFVVVEQVENDNRILHLKGRFYMKSISDVTMVPGGEEMKVFSDGKEAFTLVFKEISRVYNWYQCVKYLVAAAETTASREVDIQQQESDESSVQSVETASEKKANGDDIESQMHLIEQKEAGVTEQTKLGGKRWAMVAMLLRKSKLENDCILSADRWSLVKVCFTLQGLIMTYFIARAEFIEDN